jgi:hypothetical protein
MKKFTPIMRLAKAAQTAVAPAFGSGASRQQNISDFLRGTMWENQPAKS